MRVPPESPLVRVEHLTKVYRADPRTTQVAQTGTTVGVVSGVVDVSFDVAPGETLGMVGPSAAGKTTIGRTVLRLVEPTSGRVTMTLPSGRRVDVTALSARALRRFRRHAQMIFQDPFTSLNPRMTVAEILGEPLRVHSIVEPADILDRCRQLLDMVGLSQALIENYPSALSGGQRQRVGIARALATDPCFVVADEPVTALDVSIQAQILNLMRDLQDRLGLSYLFVSHDLAVVAHIADRIAVIADGRLVEIGRTAKIVASPEHPETQRLVAAGRTWLRR